MGKSSPPPAPDYAGAAQATAQGNKDAAIAAQAGNMVNQYTPYGKVEYTQRGTSNGTPLWSQTVTMSPEQQALFNQNQKINQQLGNVAESGVGYVQNAMANPLQGQEYVASAGNPELLNKAMTDALYQRQTQYLDPQFQQSQSNLENKLANQGITQGSEAYDRAMSNFAREKQQAYESARNAAVGQGMQAAQGMFGMNLSNANLANEAANARLAQAQTLQQNPINMLNAVRTGSQMQVGQGPSVGSSSPGQLSNWSGPDYLSAANQQYNADINNFNYKQAQNQQLWQGIMQGAGMFAPLLMKSDMRLKKNIIRVGTHKTLGIGLYIWDYIWGQKGAGVMAQELMHVKPEAVIKMDDGYYAVNYGAI